MSRALARLTTSTPATMPETAMRTTCQMGAPTSIAVTMTSPSKSEISVKPMSSKYRGRQPAGRWRATP